MRKICPMPTWLEWVLHGDAWVSLLTLTILEIVLGLDNLIFISIVCGKLPAHEQAKTRNTGLALALITRIMLLCSITWIMSLAQEWWPAEVWGIPVPNSGKDLILFAGGLFLIWNSVNEIHHRLEGDQEEHADVAAPSVRAVIGRIIVLDIIFSLDSVITAVGMANPGWQPTPLAQIFTSVTWPKTPAWITSTARRRLLVALP